MKRRYIKGLSKPPTVTTKSQEVFLNPIDARPPGPIIWAGPPFWSEEFHMWSRFSEAGDAYISSDNKAWILIMRGIAPGDINHTNDLQVIVEHMFDTVNDRGYYVAKYKIGDSRTWVRCSSRWYADTPNTTVDALDEWARNQAVADILAKAMRGFSNNLRLF